jgi:hypothetical protein
MKKLLMWIKIIVNIALLFSVGYLICVLKILKEINQ